MRTYLLLGVVVILSAILAWLFFAQVPAAEAPTPIGCTQEAKVCPDGSAVGRTGPNCEFAECQTVNTGTTDESTIVATPIPNQEVTSPITVTGKARGNWFFEASFPIIVTNWDGLIIGQGIATAQGEWMTSEFVPFTAQISYTLPPGTPYNRGTLILQKDNPSGLPEHDAAVEIPILLMHSPIGTAPVVCTMDAKMCPDGSSVGRTGPNCEFAPCP